MKKTILLSFILMLCSLANAQDGEILYVDFEPDSTQHFIYHEELFLDLDQDGASEWCYEIIPASWGHFRELRLQSAVYNDPDYEVTWVHWEHPNMLYQFHYGDTLSNFIYQVPIDPQYAWGYEHHWSGNTHHPEDHYFEPHYLGLRKRVGEDEYCYGWIEASVYIHTWAEGYTDFQSIDLTVYRAAYCTVPNYPLRVGQTSFDWTVVEDSEGDFATVHPSPTNGQVIITGNDLRSAEVYNATGQRIASTHGDGEQLQIDLSRQPAGIYFFNITDKDGRKCVRKVVKQ